MILQGFEAGTLATNVWSTDPQTVGDTAPTAVGIDSGSTFTYDATHAAHGTQATKITSTGGPLVTARWATTAHDVGAARLYLYLASAITNTESRFLQIGSALMVFGSGNGSIRIRTSGTVTWQSAASVMAGGMWLRIEVAYRRTAGQYKAALFAGDSTTPIAESGWTSAVLDTSDHNVRIGNLGTDSPIQDFWLDSLAIDTTATDFIGPSVASNADPSVSVAGPASLLAGDEGTIPATASDTDGTIASYTWSTTAGVLSGSGSSVALTNDPDRSERTATVTCTVTDDAGATAQATHDVTLTGAPVVLYDGTSWTPAVRRL